MSQIVLPNTIDAGTPMSASEVQGNFTAIRDVVNGQLEGGTGSGSNMKAKGLGLRELDAIAVRSALEGLQPGIIDATALKVTPGAGLQTVYASGRAYVTDDGGVHTSGLLVPANVAAGASLTHAANASGNPRLDQVVLTLSGIDTGTVAIVQGTPTVGATLDNRNGATALPSRSVRLADVLVPNGFAGPFVAGTHVRDRRPWARGAAGRIVRNANAAAGTEYTTSSTSFVPIDGANLGIRLETQGNPVRVRLHGFAQASTVPISAVFQTFVDGADPGGQSSSHIVRLINAGASHAVEAEWVFAPADGSHTFIPYFAASTATAVGITASAVAGLVFEAEELQRPYGANGYATGGVL